MWELIFFSSEINGIKASRLISIKLQVNKKLLVEIPNKEEINKIKINDLFLSNEMYLVLKL